MHPSVQDLASEEVTYRNDGLNNYTTNIPRNLYY